MLLLDECSPDPCQNGATCMDGVNQYTCSCLAGYEGTDCETGKSLLYHITNPVQILLP